MMKKLIILFLLLPLAFSCQYCSPGMNTMDGYAQQLSDLFLQHPASVFISNKGLNDAPWTVEDVDRELQYMYEPHSPDSWSCIISHLPHPERTNPHFNGDVQALLLISGETGNRLYAVSGTILETDGYRSDFTGEIRGNGQQWIGYFRVETSLEGRPMDWGEITFYGDQNPAFCSGTKAHSKSQSLREKDSEAKGRHGGV